MYAIIGRFREPYVGGEPEEPDIREIPLDDFGGPVGAAVIQDDDFECNFPREPVDAVKAP